jgi:hypothetical protein
MISKASSSRLCGEQEEKKTHFANYKKSEQWDGFRASVHGFLIGGADRDRTDDLHNAIVALFQLSYGPNQIFLLQEKKKRSSTIL